MADPKITPVDVRIVESLRDDARKSYARIAGELRVPESTVRHRLNRLIAHGVLEFAAVTNPLRMGYETWAMIEIQGVPSRIRAVARELARAPEVYFVGITTGRCDVFVSALFRSNAELLEFLTTRLAKVPGITRTSTSTVLEVVKRSLAPSAPAALAEAGDAPSARRAIRAVAGPRRRPASAARGPSSGARRGRRAARP